jgi:hypothetical protein
LSFADVIVRAISTSISSPRGLEKLGVEGEFGIEDGIPNHSIFSRARHARFRQGDALRALDLGLTWKPISLILWQD